MARNKAGEDEADRTASDDATGGDDAAPPVPQPSPLRGNQQEAFRRSQQAYVASAKRRAEQAAKREAGG